MAVKAILYDIDGNLCHYILLRRFRDGYQFAFGITKNQKPTFITKWSENYYATENDAILVANKLLGSHRPSLKRKSNEISGPEFLKSLNLDK